MVKNLLLFFSRLPNSSFNGKNRIKVDMDPKFVNKFSKNLILDLLDSITLTKRTYDVVFYYNGVLDKEEDDRFIYDIEYVEQSDANMGEKLSSIFQRYFQKNYKKIIVMGSDCPFINKTYIEKCFKILDSHNVVFLPMEDYGYGLIGTNKYIDIFSEIKNWKSRTENYNLVTETFLLCFKKNLSVSILPKKFDIDTKDDVIELQQRLNNCEEDEEISHLNRLKDMCFIK